MKREDLVDGFEVAHDLAEEFLIEGVPPSEPEDPFAEACVRVIAELVDLASGPPHLTASRLAACPGCVLDHAVKRAQQTALGLHRPPRGTGDRDRLDEPGT